MPRTYEDYGVSYAESRERFGEVLDIVEQAWSQPFVHYEGRYYRFNNIAVTPKPFQRPLPPIRIAAASPDTYPAVGERGLPIFINARHGSFSEFAPAVREYREAYEAAGHRGRGRVYLRVPAYLAETAGRAREEPRESLMHFYREQTERLRDSMSRGGTRAIEGRAERLERLEKLTYDEALEGQVLIGTPEAVGDKLRALQDELGIDGILAELNCGGLIPHAQVMTALAPLMPGGHAAVSLALRIRLHSIIGDEPALRYRRRAAGRDDVGREGLRRGNDLSRRRRVRARRRLEGSRRVTSPHDCVFSGLSPAPARASRSSRTSRALLSWTFTRSCATLPNAYGAHISYHRSYHRRGRTAADAVTQAFPMSEARQFVYGIAAIGRSRARWPPSKHLVREAPDRALCRINVLDFAAKNGLDEEAVIAAFLHAARLGLFELSWNVLCPGCGGVLDASATLKTVDREEYHCACAPRATSRRSTRWSR